MAAHQKQETAESDEELADQLAAPSAMTPSVAPSTNGRSDNRTQNNQRARGWQGFQFFDLQTDLSALPSVQ